MKKRLFAFIFAIVMAGILNTSSAIAQNSQSIKAEVPFAFTTNGKTLPAGSYRIEPVGDRRAVWLIKGDYGGTGLFLLALNLAGSSQIDPRLVFHVYGEEHYLAGFTTASYQVALPVSRSEKKLRMSPGPMARSETVTVETVGGGSR